MKYLKTYSKLLESNYQQLSDIRSNCNEILFEFSDKGIKYNLWGYEGVHNDGDIKDIIRIEIGDERKYIKLNEFESEFNHLLSYLESEGFVFTKRSFVENDNWDPYLKCPNCDNDDIDQEIVISGETYTCKCGYKGDVSDFGNLEHYVEDKSDFISMILSKYWAQFISLEFEKVIS